MGLQFERDDAAARDAIEHLVAQAKLCEASVDVPRRRSSIGTPEDLDPAYNYLLCAIDGQRRAVDLAEALALDHSTVELMLDKLRSLGLVDRVAASNLESSSSAANEDAFDCDTSQVRTRSTLCTPLDAVPGGAIEAKHRAITEDNHYQALGVSTSASTEEIRLAYRRLDSMLRSEAASNHRLGQVRSRVDDAFVRFNEAYRVLMCPESRAEYDAYLRRQNHLAQLAPIRNRSESSPDYAETIERLAAVRRRQARRVRAAIYRRKDAPAQPSGGSLPERCYQEALKFHRRGEHLEAARCLALLQAMDHGNVDLERRASTLERYLCQGLAEYYQQQALYEERHNKWSQAVISWGRVCAGRPEDAESHRRLASALLQAGGDLRQAVVHGRRAVQLAPTSIEAHRTLGHVYMAVNMPKSARGEFERASNFGRDRVSSRGPAERLGILRRLFAKVG